MANTRRRFLPLIFIPILLFALGTLGYVIIEDWSLIESFYMTTIALTTVGFGEVRPLSNVGRIFTIFLILLGAGSIAYGFGAVGEYLLTAGVGDKLRRRRMQKSVDKMQDHVIVCGYGRVGRSAAAALAESRRGVVVLEKAPEQVQTTLASGLAVIEGDATSDEVLRDAGIERAWGLVVCTGDDSLNLFIVLSARALNASLYIVTRSDADNEQKMLRAGANRVVSPHQIGGQHMANIVTRPHVTDFLDVVTLDGGIELWLEELTIEKASRLDGKTVGGANVRRYTGVTLVAVLRQGGGATITPDANTRLEAGDQLIVLGTREQLAALEKLTSTARSR